MATSCIHVIINDVDKGNGGGGGHGDMASSWVLHLRKLCNNISPLNSLTCQEKIHVACEGQYCYLKVNVFKSDPDTEPDDLPGCWVTGSTAGELRDLTHLRPQEIDKSIELKEKKIVRATTMVGLCFKFLRIFN
ncbi:hypothetical protein YC2023_072774 [Brassica napus]